MSRIACAVVLLIVGCDEGVTPSAGPGEDLGSTGDLGAPTPLVVRASASCSPDNVVMGEVILTLSNVADIRIEYGIDASYGRSTPTFTMPAGDSVRLPILGLTPGTANHLRVHASSPGGLTTDGDDLIVDCAALPTWMPSFQGLTGSAPESGYLLVSAGNLTAYGVAAIVDYTGRLYWYRAVTLIGDFRRTDEGNLVTYRGEHSAFDELTLAGEVVRSFTDPLASRGADNHELIPLADHHALLLGSNQRAVDTLAYIDGGSANAAELENTITEVDGDGGVVYHWSSTGQITLAETTPDINLTVVPIDGEHANSIDILPDGDLLLSLRHTDTVYKIDRQTGAIRWRLGGSRSDFTFVNDPSNGFSHQHFARKLVNGDLLLFDDGNLRSPPTSRVVQYTLDETARTATVAWEHRHTPELSSFCCGSTTRLPSGNTLTAWGSTGVIELVDAMGKALWELTIPGAIIYRAQPISALYP